MKTCGWAVVLKYFREIILFQDVPVTKAPRFSSANAWGPSTSEGWWASIHASDTQ